MFRQCKLQQGAKIQTAWIETRGAVVGKNIEVKDGSGRWDVVEVYDHELSKDALKEMQENNRNSLKSIQPIK